MGGIVSHYIQTISLPTIEDYNFNHLVFELEKNKLVNFCEYYQLCTYLHYYLKYQSGELDLHTTTYLTFYIVSIDR